MVKSLRRCLQDPDESADERGDPQDQGDHETGVGHLQ